MSAGALVPSGGGGAGGITVGGIRFVVQGDASSGTAALGGIINLLSRIIVDSSRASNALDGFSRSVDALALAFGAVKLINFIEESTLLAGRVTMLNVVMQNVGQNANYSRTQLDLLESQVKALNITTRQARQSIVMMAQAELDLSKTAQVARVAQDAAVISGKSSSDAFEAIVHGIQTTNTWVLRHQGLLVDIWSAERRWASENHRTVESLSRVEKQQIVLNEVLRQGILIAGTYETAMTDAYKRFLSLQRLTEESTRLFGEMYLPLFGKFVDLSTNLLSTWVQLDSSVKLVAAGISTLLVSFISLAAAARVLQVVFTFIRGANPWLLGISAAISGVVTLLTTWTARSKALEIQSDETTRSIQSQAQAAIRLQQIIQILEARRRQGSPLTPAQEANNQTLIAEAIELGAQLDTNSKKAQGHRAALAAVANDEIKFIEQARTTIEGLMEAPAEAYDVVLKKQEEQIEKAKQLVEVAKRATALHDELQQKSKSEDNRLLKKIGLLIPGSLAAEDETRQNVAQVANLQKEALDQAWAEVEKSHDAYQQTFSKKIVEMHRLGMRDILQETIASEVTLLQSAIDHIKKIGRPVNDFEAMQLGFNRSESASGFIERNSARLKKLQLIQQAFADEERQLHLRALTQLAKDQESAYNLALRAEERYYETRKRLMNNANWELYETYSKFNRQMSAQMMTPAQINEYIAAEKTNWIAKTKEDIRKSHEAAAKNTEVSPEAPFMSPITNKMVTEAQELDNRMAQIEARAMTRRTELINQSKKVQEEWSKLIQLTAEEAEIELTRIEGAFREIQAQLSGESEQESLAKAAIKLAEIRAESRRYQRAIIERRTTLDEAEKQATLESRQGETEEFRNRALNALRSIKSERDQLDRTEKMITQHYSDQVLLLNAQQQLARQSIDDARRKLQIDAEAAQQRREREIINAPTTIVDLEAEGARLREKNDADERAQQIRREALLEARTALVARLVKAEKEGNKDEIASLKEQIDANTKLTAELEDRYKLQQAINAAEIESNKAKTEFAKEDYALKTQQEFDQVTSQLDSLRDRFRSLRSEILKTFEKVPTESLEEVEAVLKQIESTQDYIQGRLAEKFFTKSGQKAYSEFQNMRGQVRKAMTDDDLDNLRKMYLMFGGKNAQTFLPALDREIAKRRTEIPGINKEALERERDRLRAERVETITHQQLDAQHQILSVLKELRDLRKRAELDPIDKIIGGLQHGLGLLQGIPEWAKAQAEKGAGVLGGQQPQQPAMVNEALNQAAARRAERAPRSLAQQFLDEKTARAERFHAEKARRRTAFLAARATRSARAEVGAINRFTSTQTARQAREQMARLLRIQQQRRRSIQIRRGQQHWPRLQPPRDVLPNFDAQLDGIRPQFAPGPAPVNGQANMVGALSTTMSAISRNAAVLQAGFEKATNLLTQTAAQLHQSADANVRALASLDRSMQNRNLI